MSYLHQHTHAGNRVGVAVGVGAIHVILALGLVAGLAVRDFIEDEQGPLIARNFPLPPPPPPTPKMEETAELTPKVTPDVTAPIPPIDFNRASSDTKVAEPDFSQQETTLVVERGPIGRIEPPTIPKVEAPLFDPAPPVPRNGPLGWITNDDYPSVSIRRGEEGRATYRLDVGADGRVDSCRVTRSTGFDRLDEATCRFVERRARFNPAKDDKGASVSGNYTGQVTWQLPQ